MSIKITDIEKIRIVVEGANRALTANEIVELVKDKWRDSNPRTIRAEIQILTVNSNSRIHYAYNRSERHTDQGSQIDFLFKTDQRKLEKYDPLKHGVWEIYKFSDSKWAIREAQSKRRAFLFVWNSRNWNWEKLKSGIATLDSGGQFINRWICSSHKAIRPGDRAFLIRLGEDPRGIMASGVVASEAFLAEHYSDPDKMAHYVNIDFDVLLDPEQDQILELAELSSGDLSRQKWNPQSSGISINDDLLERLELMWFEVTARTEVKRTQRISPSNSEDVTYEEGRKYDVILTRSERNPIARSKAIEYWGCKCSVCSFDFEKVYGKSGAGYIQVHHLIPVSSKIEKYNVDPKKDLRPVCPNCHAMIHKTTPPQTIEEMQEKILSNGRLY